MLRSARAFGLTVLLGWGLVCGGFLAANDGNPEWFLHFGSEESTVLPHGREVLGEDLLTPHTQGQDGQVFWLLARDPLLTDPDTFATYADRPAYRAQRILYPAGASLARIAGEDALVWAMLALNLAGVGLGAFWMHRVATAVGAPERAAIWFALNPAVAAGLLLDGSDVWAVTFVIGGLLGWVRGRDGWAAAAFAGAALAKEITLLAPLGLLAYQLVHRRSRRRGLAVSVPAAAVTAAWAVYVRIRLGWPPSQIEELAAPLTGFRDAWRRTWAPFDDWGHALTAVALLVVMIAVVLVAARRPSPAIFMALPFALLFPFLSAQVLGLAVNAVRAAGPVPSLLALAAYTPRDR